MVVPTQQHPVVGVRRTAVGPFADVINFAPDRGDVAPGDEASAVAEADRFALVGGEDPVEDPDLHDPTVRVEGDPLHHAGARDVSGDGEGDGFVAPVDVRVPGTGGEVRLADFNNQGRCRTSDRGEFTRPGGNPEDRRERIVDQLRARADLRHLRERRVVSSLSGRSSPSPLRRLSPTM